MHTDKRFPGLAFRVSPTKCEVPGRRIAAFLLLSLCAAGALPAADETRSDRPSWTDRRASGESDGAASASDKDASRTAGISGPIGSERLSAQVRSAARPRSGGSEVSLGTSGEVIADPYYPSTEITFGGTVPGHLPPDETLSFDMGAVCPPPISRPREIFWIDAEYLLWWSQGHYVPPLVTTGPTDSMGVLGDPDTDVLFGGKGLNSGSTSGGRISAGLWLDEGLALEGNLIYLAERSDTYDVSSDGDPLLARPFYNIVTGERDSHVFAFPATLAGAFSASSTSQLYGAGILMRRAIQSGSDFRIDGYDLFAVRWDALLGYRFLQLEDDLYLRESLEAAGPSSIRLYDHFETKNDFHGVDLGATALFRRNRWSLELLAKMALGNTRSQVRIDGATQTTSGGAVDNDTGGMLTQTTNIGTYTHNSMAVVPELGVTLGFNLTDHCRATFGYTLIYWSNVARPGSQIDDDLNPSYFPNNGPPSGAARPEFTFVSGDYWTQGMNVGLHVHF